MRKVSFLLIIILFLIANVTFATEPHGVAYIKLEARQNIKKNEIILLWYYYPTKNSTRSH